MCGPNVVGQRWTFTNKEDERRGITLEVFGLEKTQSYHGGANQSKRVLEELGKCVKYLT